MFLTAHLDDPNVVVVDTRGVKEYADGHVPGAIHWNWLIAVPVNSWMATPVVLDPAGDVADRFGVRGLPTTVFIDRDGSIHTKFAGVLTPAALEERLGEIR